MRIARSALVGLLRFLVAIPVTMLEALDPGHGPGGHVPPVWSRSPPTQPPPNPRHAILPITPDGGPLPHGGVCRSCGAGIAWRGGGYRGADGEFRAHAPSRCSCGGEIEVLA